MDELGLEVEVVDALFSEEDNDAYQIVRVSEEHVHEVRDTLAVALRRCYIGDSRLDELAVVRGVSKSEIIRAVLPDPGSVMAGDFGEVLSFIYQATSLLPKIAIGPKKWRLKNDRTKPVGYSDVVHFVLPDWPDAGVNDELLCAEVKTKSTAGASTPISSALDDVVKDRTSRLAKTLTWLRERILLGHDLGRIEQSHLERFINAVDYPAASKDFFAIAVVCTSLFDEELDGAPEEAPEDCTLVVISVPALQELYSDLYASVLKSAEEVDPEAAGAAEPE